MKRLRAYPSPAELARLYASPHDHTQWVDHRIRVGVTAELGRHVIQPDITIADLSCGDAAIATRLSAALNGRCRLILGDIAAGYEHHGPIEQTIRALPGPVDLFLCCETLEHLDDPALELLLIRRASGMLLLSTPIDEADSSNPEHIWSWSVADVRGLLADAGWKPSLHSTIDFRDAGGQYAYQLWVCT